MLNFKKTAMTRCGGRQTVTGIVVNEKLNLPSEYLRKLRQEIYYCRKYGAKSHTEMIGATEKEYLQSLLGRASYALQIRPDDVKLKEAKTWLVNEIKSRG